MAGGGVASGSRVFSKFLKPSYDIQAAALWGVTAGAGALWVVQPFEWLKKTFFEKPQAEGQ